MDLNKVKALLKNVKLQENNLSVIFGVIFIIIIGITVLNFFNKNKGEIPVSVTAEENLTQSNIHKVQKGDDLWKIAEKYYNDGYKWSIIAEENNIANPGIIEIDQEIKIPEVEKAVVEANIPTTPTGTISLNFDTKDVDTQITESITAENYIVVKGDNLWDICVRAYNDGYKWSEIAKVNNIKNPNLILPGMSLTLPR